MRAVAHAAIDRNVWQYLVDVHADRYDPRADPQPRLAAERLAMYRLVLWGVRLRLLPMVIQEARRITDPALRRANEGMRMVFLEEFVDELDELSVAQRARELLRYHADPDDCRLVAEAEAAGIAPVLLTFDERLVRRLALVARMRLLAPTTLWTELAIPPGTPPEWTPDPKSNPLAPVTWWRW